jgi:hypothetical protein
MVVKAIGTRHTVQLGIRTTKTTLNTELNIEILDTAQGVVAFVIIRKNENDKPESEG